MNTLTYVSRCIHRLQKLNVSMSYKTTNELVKAIGEGHDSVVKVWRDYFASNLISQVSTYTL